MTKERNSRKFDFSKPNENRFDFTKDEPDVVEAPQQPNTISNPDAHAIQPNKNSNTGKIVGSIAVAAAIIAGIFFFTNKESEVSNDNTPTEVIAQNTENQEEENEATATESSNEDATAESEGVPTNGSEESVPENTDESPASSTPAANPASAKDNQVADKPAKSRILLQSQNLHSLSLQQLSQQSHLQLQLHL